MACRLHRDSAPEPAFPSLVLKLNRELRKNNLAALKFLCSDVISPSRLEDTESAIELINNLKMRALVGPNNLEFLAELLLCIKRYDLVELMGYAVNSLKSKLPLRLQPFRLMLHGVCQDLGASELDSLKYMLSDADKLGRAASEKIQDTYQLMTALEERRLIASTNVAYLADILAGVERHDLANNVQAYQALVSPSCTVPTMSLNEPRHEGFRGKAISTLPQPHTQPSLPTGETAKTPSVGRTPCQESYVTDAPAPSRQRSQLHYPDELLSAETIPSNQTEPGNATEARLQNSNTPGYDPSHPKTPSYKMEALPRGICLIMSNEIFSEQMKNRVGCEVDCKNFEELFKDLLKFETHVYRNLPAQEMMKTFADWSGVDHSKYDCFIVCITTHGTNGVVYGSDEIPVYIRSITKRFNGSNCRTLAGKPKLFFIQACQGKELQGRVTVHMDSPGEEPEVADKPEDADILVSQSTLPGYASLRHEVTGSWYVDNLCRQVRELASSEDLVSILTTVNAAVGKEQAQLADGRVCKQMPAPHHTLTKKVFFNVPAELYKEESNY